MKKFKPYLMIFFLASVTIQLWAGKDEYSKIITKQFDINKDAVLDVKNKFGKVHCENWDKNSISIEVTITIEASNEEKANKYFDKIDIDISGDRSRVTASTSFIDNVFGNEGHEISIDYMINLPKSVSLELKNKFGDIILNEVEGSLSVDVSYGSMRAKRVTNDKNDIEIKFGEGYVGYLKGGNLELKYSEFEIGEADELYTESKFSELGIGKIDVLTLESGYDDDYIGQVRDLDVESSFSDIEIRKLEERLVTDCDYGELKVKEVAKEFKLIDISNSFSDVDVGFHSEASFMLTATVKMGDLSYPKDKAKLSVVDISYTSDKYEGLIGDNGDTKSKVIVESKNSGITLFYR